MSYNLSTNTDANKKVIAALESLADATTGVESVSSGIRDHNDTFYVKPATRSYAQMAEIAGAAAAEEKEMAIFAKTFRYRPWDGAFATQKTLFDIYGYGGFGKATESMFGSRPPAKITIEVGPNESIEVPWGELSVPDLKATLTLGGAYDKEYGQVFSLMVTAPKKMERAIKGLFTAIENTLKTQSIYKGKAINGASQPEFIDPFAIDRHKVIYTKTVEQSLIGLLWNPIRFTEEMRTRGISRKRAVLLAGPYGTGKSLTGMLTAQEALEHGWTYILCRPGKDNLEEVMQTARLYQPSVVFYEDVDVLASTNDAGEVQRLLDVFDGITSKGTEVMVVMTTNNISHIHKGMLRPGRMDGIITIAGLDAEGCQRMVTAMCGDRLADDVDLDVVGRALEAYEPAFVAEAIKRADTFNLDRSDVKLRTEDFIGAAESLRPQWEQYEGARETKALPTLDHVFTGMVNTAVTDLFASEKIVLEDDNGNWSATAKVTENANA